MRISFGRSADDIFFESSPFPTYESIREFNDFIVTCWRGKDELIGFEISERYPSRPTAVPIQEAQRLLRSNGLLEGGSLYEIGNPLSQDGVNGPATRKALKIFQALYLYGGNDGVLDGLPDDVTPTLLKALRQFENVLLWSRIDQDMGSVVDWPAPGGDVYDGYGSQCWATVLRKLAARFGSAVAVNDVSLPSGGPFVACSGQMLHDTHQTGIDVDFPLPTIDGSLRRLTWRDPAYDRIKMRSFLHAVNDLKVASRIWFNDPDLVAEGLCKGLQYHDDHAHVRLKNPFPTVSSQKVRDFWWSLVTRNPPGQATREMFEYVKDLTVYGYHPTRRHLYSLSGRLMFFHGVPLVSDHGASLVVAVQHRKVINIQIVSVQISADHVQFSVSDNEAQRFSVLRGSGFVFDLSSMPMPMRNTHPAVYNT